MKRDIDLIRSILLSMESNGHGFSADRPVIDGYTTNSDLSPSAIPLSLTWDGHDFLDSVKDETLWKKAKSMVLKPAGGVAFDVLLAWVKAEAKQRLGLP